MIRFNISTKFLMAFALLFAVMLGGGLFAEQKIGEVNALSQVMRDHWLPSSQTLGDLHAYISQYRIKQSEQISAPSPAMKTRSEKLMRNARAAIEGQMGDYQKLIATPEQKAAYDQLRASWDAYTAQSDRIIALSATDNTAARAQFEGASVEGFYTVEDSILALIDLNNKGASATSAQSVTIYRQARVFMFVAVSVAVAITLALMAVMMRSIARPINQMSEVVKHLVEGDLEVEVPGTARHDELGALARALVRFKDLFAADQRRAQAEIEQAHQMEITIAAIGGGLEALAQGQLTHRVAENGHGALAKLHVDYNAAVSRLADVLGEIVEGCRTIKAGTEEIASASSDLARRTEHQANSLAETAQTLNGFTRSVTLAADNARQTSGRLGTARQTAQDADDTASRAVVAIRGIEASSREMAEIISTIDGIAFQTNLLALNAGVEAARAGESGRGFAVVANEVRALAQRSAEAAKDIKELITASGAQVSHGVALVESSGNALRQIVDEVGSVSALVDEIAQAAQSQASGIAEISGMVSRMDQFTQQNAAMVEQSSASTHNLSRETAHLVERLGLFRLGHARDAETSKDWTEMRVVAAR